jgi:hypothetical protein
MAVKIFVIDLIVEICEIYKQKIKFEKDKITRESSINFTLNC